MSTLSSNMSALAPTPVPKLVAGGHTPFKLRSNTIRGGGRVDATVYPSCTLCACAACRRGGDGLCATCGRCKCKECVTGACTCACECAEDNDDMRSTLSALY